ncbi:response regulator [bacterium]|nr:response regulator [bacterium]
MKYEVMIVDDEISVLHTVKSLLDEANIPTRTALSGLECLRELEKGFKGLILMDIVMPEMNGYETIQAISDKGYKKDILICLLTGQQTLETQIQKYQDYVLDYIKKPIDTKTLVNAVKQYLAYLKPKK